MKTSSFFKRPLGKAQPVEFAASKEKRLMKSFEWKASNIFFPSCMSRPHDECHSNGMAKREKNPYNANVLYVYISM